MKKQSTFMTSEKEHKVRNLTGFLKRHFCSLQESIGPLHQKHSNQTPSLAISASRWPRTR